MYPIHFASFILFGSARESDLEHRCQRNGIGVVSAEDESVGVVSGLPT